MSVQIAIKHAVKRYGNVTIIPDLNLQIEKGEFFTLLGASGCGKTTLLRMIAGFNTIEGGEFYFNDKLINDIPRDTRNIGMVFQNYAIFPHMTTAENVGFGLEQRKIKDPEKAKRVNEILETVQISALKDRKPRNMSGGQQQRIALARAIVIQPDVLLMDEPLSNLDAKLRIEMRSAIRAIQKEFGITTVYVTHDQNEALAISDKIAIMNHGQIMQVATPWDIYRHPANLFCATFIGESNLINGNTVGSQKVSIENENMTFTFSRLKKDLKEQTSVQICVRPDELYFAQSGLAATIVERTFLGSSFEYFLQLNNKTKVKLNTKSTEEFHEIGEHVYLGFSHELVNVFDTETGNSLMIGTE